MNLSKSVVLGTYTLAENLENLEWLKLNDYRIMHICMTDKIAIRKNVSQRTNDPILLNHLYGVYDSPDEIHLGKLPSEFVIKTNHWSSCNFICGDRDEFNFEVRNRLNLYMDRLYGYDKVE